MSKEQNQALDHISAKEMPAFATVMPKVTSEHGKSLPGQLKDLMSLCLRGNKLMVDEYYQMCLFDDGLFSMEDKKQFVGLQKSREIWSAIAETNPWYGFMSDKLAAETMMRGFGVSVTKTLAVVGGNYPGNAFRKIGSPDELHSFFSTVALPLFGKPVNSNQSLGSARFEKYDSAKRTMQLANGNTVTVDELWAEISEHFQGDYIFQQCLESHDKFKKLCGGGLPTVRIVTLDHGDGPEFYRACVKLTGKDNVADNFWRKGNLLAPVNQANGEMDAALTAMGIDGEFVDSHPDTQQKITGEAVPFWKEACELALEVAGFYKGALLIGFDIAITNKGPVIVEVNNDPHLIMLQAAFRKGVLDKKMLAAVAYANNLKSERVSSVKQKLADEQRKNKADLKDAVSTKAA